MDFYPDGGSVQQGCMFGIDALPGGFIAFSWPYFVMFSDIRSLQSREVTPILPALYQGGGLVHE